MEGMAPRPDGKRLVDQQLLSPIPPPPSSPPPPMIQKKKSVEEKAEEKSVVASFSSSSSSDSSSSSFSGQTPSVATTQGTLFSLASVVHSPSVSVPEQGAAMPLQQNPGPLLPITRSSSMSNAASLLLLLTSRQRGSASDDPSQTAHQDSLKSVHASNN